MNEHVKKLEQCVDILNSAASEIERKERIVGHHKREVDRLKHRNRELVDQLAVSRDEVDEMLNVAARLRERAEKAEAELARVGAAKAKGTRYPWHEAPEWATYAATDEAGQAYWYSRRPHSMRAAWVEQGGSMMERITSHDWKNSLEARPAEAPAQTLGQRVAALEAAVQELRAEGGAS